MDLDDNNLVTPTCEILEILSKIARKSRNPEILEIRNPGLAGKYLKMYGTPASWDREAVYSTSKIHEKGRTPENSGRIMDKIRIWSLGGSGEKVLLKTEENDGAKAP